MGWGRIGMIVNFSESYQKREREIAYGDLLLIGLFIKNFFLSLFFFLKKNIYLYIYF